MARPRTRRPRFGVFAEGPRPYDPEPDQRNFRELWSELCRACGCSGPIRVYGFSKKNIVLLKEPVDQPRLGWSEEPLDILIQRMQAEDGFENAIIAFDRWPPNKEIQSKTFCLRTEVNFILTAFLKRGVLSGPLLDSAKALLARHEQAPGRSRQDEPLPYGPLEFIYMDPNFEGLLVSDEAPVLRALGLDQRPKDWPTFGSHSREPGQHILQRAIDLAAKSKRRGFPSFKADKHGWALKIVREAADTSSLWEHEIAKRLGALVS